MVNGKRQMVNDAETQKESLKLDFRLSQMRLDWVLEGLESQAALVLLPGSCEQTETKIFQPSFPF